VYGIEWDPKKAAANIRKHDVTFQEVAKVFPTEAAVNEALMSLINVAQKSTGLTSNGRAKKLRAG
jgi:uncharacterized DUF497 family protein